MHVSGEKSPIRILHLMILIMINEMNGNRKVSFKQCSFYYKKLVVERFEIRVPRLRKVVNQDIYRRVQHFSDGVNIFVICDHITKNNASFKVSKARIPTKMRFPTIRANQ